MDIAPLLVGARSPEEDRTFGPDVNSALFLLAPAPAAGSRLLAR
jgi:hypothetical protein